MDIDIIFSETELTSDIVERMSSDRILVVYDTDLQNGHLLLTRITEYYDDEDYRNIAKDVGINLDGPESSMTSLMTVRSCLAGRTRKDPVFNSKETDRIVFIWNNSGRSVIYKERQSTFVTSFINGDTSDKNNIGSQVISDGKGDIILDELLEGNILNSLMFTLVLRQNSGDMWMDNLQPIYIWSAITLRVIGSIAKIAT